MAKKKTKARDEKKPAEELSTLSKAKAVVVKAAGKVAEVVTQVAEAAKVHVVTPVAEAAGIVEKKKSRYVREKKVKTPEETVAPTTARRKTTAGKMMSKNVPMAPIETPKHGPPKSKKKS